MKFAAKLAKLTADANKQKIGREAGLPATAVSDYIAKGNVPRADKALALARALNVSLDWLIDDAQDWPPPKFEKLTASSISDSDLMFEVLKRRHAVHLDLQRHVERAEQTEWSRVRERLAKLKPGDPVPVEILSESLSLYAILATYMRAISQFEIQTYETYNTQIEKHFDISPSDELELYKRYEKVMSNPDLTRVMEAVGGRPNVFKSDEAKALVGWMNVARMVAGEKTIDAVIKSIKSPEEKKQIEELSAIIERQKLPKKR